MGEGGDACGRGNGKRGKEERGIRRKGEWGGKGIYYGGRRKGICEEERELEYNGDGRRLTRKGKGLS